jgi:hypothetical protein
MSGAEAILVLGVISSVITVVETIVKIYNDVKEADGIPATFREAARRLPLVRDTLRIAESRIHDRSLDEEGCRAIKPTVEECKDKALRLELVFRKVMPQGEFSRLERYRIAIRALGQESKVETLMTAMLGDVQLLAQNHAVKAATEAQVGMLAKAIEELAAMPPSMAEEAVEKSSISNYGSGTQNVNTGAGSQNNNTGGGRQFIGENLYFGKED